MFRKMTLLFFTMLIISTAWGQEWEWGEISDKEFSMTSIKEDPEADAVVLFDIGRIDITPAFETIFKRHIRIKILTEKGKDEANVKIPFFHEDDLDDIEAVSYLPNGDEFELDDDNIFEEGVKSWRKKVFAIPGVEVGSVIELRYSIYSEYVTYLEPWYFQRGEYTKFSELSVYVPNGFGYQVFRSNLTNYDIVETQGEDWNRYQTGKKLRKFVWTGKNIPGIKDEPYMNNLDDYMAKIDFQLMSFVSPYVNYTFVKTWDDIAEKFRDFFQKRLEEDDGVEELNQSLLSGVTNEQEKIEKIYNFVCQSIGHDSKGGFYSDEVITVEKVLEAKKGNKLEKNLLLVSLLRQAKLDAKLVPISSKSHGKFFSGIVKIGQFNHALVLVQLENSFIFLDATDKFCPMGMVPINYRVPQGLLINEDNGKIIALDLPKAKSRKDIETIGKLQDDGSLVLETYFFCDSYIANSIRKSIDKKGEKEYFEDLIDDLYENAALDSFIVTNFDSLSKPLELTFYFKLPDYVQKVGNLVYFQPPLFTKIDDNPFKSKIRYFPIDYSKTVMYSERVKINLPESYKTSEIPKRVKRNIPKFTFSTFYFASDNIIEINRNYRRNKIQFHQNEYHDLRNMFDRIVEADDSQIIIESI